MSLLRLPRLSYSLRALWVVVTLSALVAAGALRWRDAGEEFARQQAYCDDLVRTLGGTETLWIDKEVGVFCGVYSRPQGLEFVCEKRSPCWATMYRSDLREVTAVDVSYATWNSLSDSPVRAAVFRRLARLHSLRRLSININKLTEPDLLPLVELPNVEQITLHVLDQASADAVLAILGRMPTLREIDVQFSSAAINAINSPEQVEFLASHTEKLADGSSNKSAAKISPTGDGEEDEFLPSDDDDRGTFAVGRMPVIGLSARGFAHLRRLRDLQSLSLGNAVILDDGLAALASVKELYLSQCRIARAGYAGLAGCRQLVELNLISTDLPDEAAAAIGTLPNLRKLSLFEDVTDQQLAQICGQHRLEDLSLWNVNKLSPDGLKPLRDSPIKRLHVEIGHETAPQFLSQLSMVSTLRELEFQPMIPCSSFCRHSQTSLNWKPCTSVVRKFQPGAWPNCNEHFLTRRWRLATWSRVAANRRHLTSMTMPKWPMSNSVSVSQSLQRPQVRC